MTDILNNLIKYINYEDINKNENISIIDIFIIKTLSFIIKQSDNDYIKQLFTFIIILLNNNRNELIIRKIFIKLLENKDKKIQTQTFNFYKKEFLHSKDSIIHTVYKENNKYKPFD
jgi:hypothetical protein